MPLELESKLRIPDVHVFERIMADAAICEACQEEFRAVFMESYYYDTPGHDLHARGWSLRLRREGGAVPVMATLKTPVSGGPAGLFLRQEWFSQAENIRQAVEDFLFQGAPGELRDWSDALTARCRLTYERSRGVLEWPGAMIELDFDRGEMEADGKIEPFFEVEAELLFGDARQLIALLNDLMARFSLAADLTSKYERSLRLIRSRRK